MTNVIKLTPRGHARHYKVKCGYCERTLRLQLRPVKVAEAPAFCSYRHATEWYIEHQPAKVARAIANHQGQRQ